MILTVLTACTGADWQALRSIVEPNLREYTKRWGYDFMILETFYRDASWHYPVQKTAWVRDVIEENKSDFFWVVDIDLICTNMTVDVRQWLDDEHSIFMARDVSGNLNCGSYLIRNSTITKAWLDSILRLREETTSEQDAIIRLSENKIFRNATKELSHPSLNSSPWERYPSMGRKSVEEGQWEPGQFICHLPGRTPRSREEIFTELLPQVIR